MPEAAKLPDTVIHAQDTPSTDLAPGCQLYMPFNGPTDQLDLMCSGMVTLDPGATPHPPHRHPDEEFIFIATGTGEIECDGKTTQVGPGSIMYCAGNVLHGIVNTGDTPMTFFFSKWFGKGFGGQS